MPTKLKPKDIKAGLVIDYIVSEGSPGTLYKIVKAKYRKCALGRTPDKVKVVNAETGKELSGWYSVKLIIKHGKKVEG